MIAAYARTDFGIAYGVVRAVIPPVLFVMGWAFMNEAGRLYAFAGLALVVLGLLLFAVSGYNVRRQGSHGMLLATSAGGVLAFALLFDVNGIRACAEGSACLIPYAVASSLVTATGLGLVSVVQRTNPFAVLRNHAKLCYAGAALLFLSYLCGMWAYVHGPIGLVAPLRESGIVFGGALAVLVLRERVSRLQWAAVGLATIGSFLFRSGSRLGTSSAELPHHVKRWRAVTAASIGNALEWFDFIIFGLFAVTLAKVFFPAGNDTASLLLTLASFGITFVMRLFGAIVIGNFGDRRGRKAALTLTMSMMMAGTAITALAPTYSTIGPFAPLLIIAARMVQGFSAGGEFGSATVFLAEQSPKQRGFYASWQFAGQALATVLATSIGAALNSTLTMAQLDLWGWRIPFVFGLLIGPVGYYIRRHIDETAEFRPAQTSWAPLRETLAHAKTNVLIAIGLIVLVTVATYTVLFMPTYATRELRLPPADGFLAVLLTGTIQVVLIPLVGALSDRFGRLPVAAAAIVAMLISIYPMFAWLAATPTLETLLIFQAVIGVIIAAYGGAIPALMSELFPAHTRTTALSISYSLGVAIFGGFAPFINAGLIAFTGSNLSPSYYLMLAAAISLVALVAAYRLGFR
jgi:MFS transporter, MHS family, proline/betaine transporter